MIINDLKNYRNATIELQSRFTGLPNAQGKLVLLLISRADPATGLVENLSCRDLANLLTVDRAPGRKGAGVPEIETIRSYLRTIANSFPNEFKLINQGQKIAYQFIDMPKIYASFFTKQEEVYGVVTEVPPTQIPLINTGESSDYAPSFSGDEYGELYGDPSGSPVYITNLTYNITNLTKQDEGKNFKEPISPDFHPSPETIQIAINSGFTKVTDTNEIQKFIQHNLEKNRKWEDFNPVFLLWLEKEQEFAPAKPKQEPTVTPINSRSTSYERSSHKGNSYERAMEKARLANPNPVAPNDLFALKPLDYRELITPAHPVALDPAHSYLRTVIHQ